MSRSRAASLVLVLSLVVAGAACGGDDGGQAGTTTTSTTTAGGRGDGPVTSEDEGTTTLPEETTTTAASPVAGPDDLRAGLVDPARVGGGFALDHTQGTGAFSGELCEDVTLEATWDDQASHALALGAGDDHQLVTQAVLAFADEATAEAFAAAAGEGHRTCLSEGVSQDVDAGDEAVLIEVDSGETSSSLAVVRVGARASVFTALYPTAAGDPVTAGLLVTAAAALAG